MLRLPAFIPLSLNRPNESIRHASSFVDQPKVIPIPYENGFSHPQEQSGAHHARNSTDVHFQPRRIGNWVDLAIDNVVAVVRHKQAIALTVRSRPTAEFAQPSLAQGQGERRHLDWQLAARSQLRDEFFISD